MRSRRFTIKFLFISVLLTLSALLSWQAVFAGGADPEPVVYDSRICGRPGNTTHAQTIRWTDIFATADPATTYHKSYSPNTPVTIIGRDFWGCWVSVQGDPMNGWIPVNALNARGVLDLPILVDNSNGCRINNGQVTCPFGDSGGGANSGNVARWTDLFSAMNPSSHTGKTIPPNGHVNIVSRNGGWVQVTSEYGNGYIPANALK